MEKVAGGLRDEQVPATTGAEATAGAGAVDNARDITAAERTDCITTTATGRSASAGACSAETEANCAALYESKARETHRVGQDENDADFAASYSLIGEIHLCEWRAELHRCEAGQVVKVCPEESAAAGEPGHVVETSMEEEDEEEEYAYSMCPSGEYAYANNDPSGCAGSHNTHNYRCENDAGYRDSGCCATCCPLGQSLDAHPSHVCVAGGNAQEEDEELKPKWPQASKQASKRKRKQASKQASASASKQKIEELGKCKKALGQLCQKLEKCLGQRRYLLFWACKNPKKIKKLGKCKKDLGQLSGLSCACEDVKSAKACSTRKAKGRCGWNKSKLICAKTCGHCKDETKPSKRMP